MKPILFVITISLFLLSAQTKRHYVVTTQKLLNHSLISNSSGSAWKYNYNAAAFPDGKNINLLVRSQDLKNASVPFKVGPSYLSSAVISFDSAGNLNSTQARDVVFKLDPVTETCGTEDPRIAVKDGLYYLMYTAYNCTHPRLSLATSRTPFDINSWTKYGVVFPKRERSKSGAILFATAENKLSQHYLIWGDTSLYVSTSKDGINWEDSNDLLIKTRKDHFDSFLVESGPAPLPLSSGDFLFIYNSAKKGVPSVKPGWNLEYNLGFLILDGAEPTKIVQRSEVPIMSPTLEWEKGNTTDYLVPNVVFLEGLVPEFGGCPKNVGGLVKDISGTNIKHECFLGVYGGSDSELGAARVIVSWIESEDSQKESDQSSSRTTHLRKEKIINV